MRFFYLTKRLRILFFNYVSHKTVTFDDRDPPWINKNAKQLHLGKNETHERYVKENKDPELLAKVKYLQNELNSIIKSNKQKNYSHLSYKLVDPMTSVKPYWSTLKMFLNNNKIPCISSLSHQNKHGRGLIERAEILNSFFPEQCFLINNSSKLPSTFLKRTEKVISSISFISNDIAKIIREP